MQTATLIWFGQELMIYGDDGLSVSTLTGDAIEAVCTALSGLPKPPKAIRLIYQPTDLDTHPVEVPKAGRAALAKILENDGHTLSDAWGLLNLSHQGRTYSTLLVTEAQPRLPQLQERLAQLKIQIIGVWPLAAVLDAIPPFNKPGAPGIAVIQSATAALVYAVDRASTRSVNMATGAAFRDDTIVALQQQIAGHDPAQMPAVVFARSDKNDIIVQAIAQVSTTTIEFDALVEAVGKLPTSSLANMLPKEFRVNYNAAAFTAGFATIGFAVLLAFFYIQDLRHVAEDTARNKSQSTQLTAKIEHLRKNKDAIEENKNFVAEASPPPPAVRELLAKIAQVIPEAVSLRSLTVRNSTFTIEGNLFTGANTASSPYHTFYDKLAEATEWKLAEGSRQTTATPDFSIVGTFTK